MLWKLPQLKPKARQIPVRLQRLIRDGLTFRWMEKAADKGLGKRQKRKLARRAPREARLEAEKQERLRRLSFMLTFEQKRRARRQAARREKGPRGALSQ